MAKNVKHPKDEVIRLNKQTAANLIKYLQGFPRDAKVVIHGMDNTGYHNYDCQVGCNFEHQQKTNTIIVFRGDIIA